MISYIKRRIQKISKKQWVWLSTVLMITLVGVGLRVWWINHIPVEQKYDFATYYTIAKNISEGKGHSLDGQAVAWQGCGYSYALGCYFRLTNDSSEYNGKVFNVLVSSATLILAYLIYAKLYGRKTVVALAYVVTALYPNLIAYTNVLGTETLTLFFMCVLLWLPLYVRDKRILYPLLGVFCAAAALTKPYMLVYPVIIAVADWVRDKKIKQAFLLLAIVASVSIVLIAPWTYRNYRHFGRFIPVSYNGGYVLYVNNNDSNITGNWMDLAKVDASDETKRKIDEYLEYGNKSIKLAPDIEPFLRDEAKKWIRNNPLEFVKLGFLRVKTTFFQGTNDVFQWSLNSIDKEFTGWTEKQYIRNMYVLESFFDSALHILSSAAVLFLLTTLKRYVWACFSLKNSIDNPTNIVFINIAFFVVVFFVFEGHARYNFPVLVLLIAALGLVVQKLCYGSSSGESEPGLS